MAITTLLVVMLMTAAIMRSIVMGMRQSRQSAVELQAQWIADAAAARAAAQLRTDREYAGETWQAEVTPGREDVVGIAEIHVEPLENSNQRRLTIDVRYPDHPWRRVAISRTYQIEIPNKQPPAGNREGVGSLWRKDAFHFAESIAAKDSRPLSPSEENAP